MCVRFPHKHNAYNLEMHAKYAFLSETAIFKAANDWKDLNC